MRRLIGAFTVVGVLALVGVLAAPAITGADTVEPTGPTGATGPTGPTFSCGTTAGPVTISRIWAMPPGGRWQDASQKLCVRLDYRAQQGMAPPNASYGLFDLTGGLPNQDLASIYPAGTIISFDLTSTGAAPVMVEGAMADPVARFNGQTVEVQGKTTPVTFALSYSQGLVPDCAAGTMTFKSFFGGGVVLEPSGPAPRQPPGPPGAQPPGPPGSGPPGSSGPPKPPPKRPAGAFFGSNAMVVGDPQVASDGSVSIRLEGCGDGNPSTKEGFFQGFLPLPQLAQGGLDATTLNALPPQAVDSIMQIDNNGRPDPSAAFTRSTNAATTPKPTPGQPVPSTKGPTGITIDYHLSYSSHTLKTKVNTKQARAAAKLVKSCKARHGRLSYQKPRGKKPGKLLCQIPRSRGHKH